MRASAWISRSRHSARFASPVSGSCSASWRICSSLRSRPIAVASTFAMPRRKFSWSSLSGCAGDDADLAEDLVAGADLEAQRGAARRRAPGGQRDRLADHERARQRERLAQLLDRLGRQVGDVRARQRALAQRRDGRDLRRLALHARERLAVGGHVAPDRQQQRAGLGLDDAPAHLADELGAVAAQAVRAGREAQRVVGREVELHVARVALAQALGPQRPAPAGRAARRGRSRTATRRGR